MSKSDTRKVDEALANKFPPHRIIRCLVEQMNVVAPVAKQTPEFKALVALMDKLDADFPGAAAGRERRKKK